jgi:ADP-ribosylglycohydrolase
MININKDSFYDKVYGCWIGKSIGGTLGTPFEGKRELLNVTGFNSEPGKPLPNDDLDLQLVWLKAIEDYGPLGVNEQILGEYWINFIPPHWNEYGIGKSNMKAGLLPPLSGQYENAWKHSNGAWIRSEIWACCAPGCPEIATKYAWYDACVDHGTGEGTYAELFTASVESAAFIVSDRDTLINIGLSYIPEDCRVARSIRIALDGYKRGLDWKETRQLVLDDSADLGWFQAPANVAYFVIGWLYGEGDFKKSLITAINCGDDTDCTGATLGSILGIINGAAALPEDWKKYVGDDILSVAIDRGSLHDIPSTCKILTNRVINMAAQVLAAHHAPVSISNEKTELSDLPVEKLMASRQYLEQLSKISSAIKYDFIHSIVEINYVSGANISAGQEASICITVQNKLPDPRHMEVTYFLPEGFELLEGRKHISLSHSTSITSGSYTFNVRLKAGSSVQGTNRGIIQIVAIGRPTVILLPILLLGE